MFRDETNTWKKVQFVFFFLQLILVLVVVGDALPDAHHVVGGDGHHVVVVMRGRHFINDDIMPIQRYFARVFQVIILQFGPHQTRTHVYLGTETWRGRIFAHLR